MSLVKLTDDEIDVLASVIERTTGDVLGVIESMIADRNAAVWHECLQAVAWALDNGPADRALPYVGSHNPYKENA